MFRRITFPAALPAVLGQEQEGAAAGRDEGIKYLLAVDARRRICKVQLGCFVWGFFWGGGGDEMRRSCINLTLVPMQTQSS